MSGFFFAIEFWSQALIVSDNIRIMEILGKLFGGISRVKVMRLFLFNSGLGFESTDVALKSKISSSSARKEISFLSSFGFIKRTKITKQIKKKIKKNIIVKNIKVDGWTLNDNFGYINSLRDLLIDSKFLERDEVLSRFKGIGNVKLFIISGLFIKDEASRIDIMIVGDGLKRGVIEKTLKNIESEIGKELRYAVLDTGEFTYRLDMYDKFIRDVLDYPHERLIDKIKPE